MPIPLQCQCGLVRGHVLQASGGMRVVCYCDDCQAFAHALHRPDLLDEHGGSDIWQNEPAQVRLTQGLDQLRCLRLSDKGMLRWHTACCGTPIGNTMASVRVPFIGLLTAFVAVPQAERDTVLGPPIAWVQGRFATGQVPAWVHQTASPGLMARFVWRITKGFVTRAYRPTPLFDASGQPVVVPRVLSVAEREALRRGGSGCTVNRHPRYRRSRPA
jgi:hypothetical protein